MLHRVEADGAKMQGVFDGVSYFRDGEGLHQPQHLHVLPAAVFLTIGSIAIAGLMQVPYVFDVKINVLAFAFSAAIGVLFGYTGEQGLFRYAPEPLLPSKSSSNCQLYWLPFTPPQWTTFTPPLTAAGIRSHPRQEWM